MYYALLHSDNSIIASGSFRECSDEAQALYPTPPGHAADYYIVSGNWFTAK